MAGNSWTPEYAKWIMQSFRDQVIEISSGLLCNQDCRQKIKRNVLESTEQLHTSNHHSECSVHIYVNCESRGANTVITEVHFQSYERGQSIGKNSELSCLDSFLIFISFPATFFLYSWKQKKSWKRMDGQLLAMKETGSGRGHADCFSLQDLILILGLNHS